MAAVYRTDCIIKSKNQAVEDFPDMQNGDNWYSASNKQIHRKYNMDEFNNDWKPITQT